MTAMQALQHKWIRRSKHKKLKEEAARGSNPIDQDIIDSMLTFDKYSKFKQTALEVY